MSSVSCCRGQALPGEGVDVRVASLHTRKHLRKMQSGVSRASARFSRPFASLALKPASYSSPLPHPPPPLPSRAHFYAALRSPALL